MSVNNEDPEFQGKPGCSPGVFVVLTLAILFGSCGACSLTLGSQLDYGNRGRPMDPGALGLSIGAIGVAIACVIWAFKMRRK